MSDAEREGIARHLLVAARLDAPDRVPLDAVARTLGVDLAPGAPPGCAGTFEGNPLRIRYNDRGHPAQVAAVLAHELAHLAAEVAGVARPHDEEDIDGIAAALRMPRAAVLRAIRTVGWNAERLGGAFPDVEPSAVFARAARVAEGVAVFRAGAGRTIVADERLEAPPVRACERRLVAAVRATGRPAVDPSGLGAWPFVDPGDRGGIVVLGPSLAWHLAHLAESA
ncbi:MAG: ImmA/IrrE family metallo-endopeptidase [Deltaproteobacteria bacterium]|nr:ImmA/IrrE family metallo-endopeptidase [Deltaproteobacteria bacterium]